MKRIVQLLFLFFIFNFACYGDIYLDEGTFISAGNIEDSNLKTDNTHLYKSVKGETLTLLYKIGNHNFGSFSIDGLAPGFVINKKLQGNELLLKCVLDFPISEIQESDNQFTDYNIIKIIIVDNDEIIINDLVFFFEERRKHFYRISGPAKIPIQNAVLNDSRVRLRVKPNLDCETWAFLDKGLPVKIKDKSPEPYEIDGENWYWYRVDAENLPDGWVYGKYLDIEECAKEN